MTKKPELTWDNVKSFLEGNISYYKQYFLSSPPYLQEQYHYRLSVCRDSCIPNDSCEVCTCPPIKKAWVTKSCNNGEKFPDLMDEESWEDFKNVHDIDIPKILKENELQ